MNSTPSCRSFERPTTFAPLSSVCTCMHRQACCRCVHKKPGTCVLTTARLWTNSEQQGAYIVYDADTGAAQIAQVPLCIVVQIRACGTPHTNSMPAIVRLTSLLARMDGLSLCSHSLVDSHTARRRPRAKLSNMMPAIWRPFPTPAPSPMKKPAPASAL